VVIENRGGVRTLSQFAFPLRGFSYKDGVWTLGDRLKWGKLLALTGLAPNWMSSEKEILLRPWKKDGRKGEGDRLASFTRKAHMGVSERLVLAFYLGEAV